MLLTSFSEFKFYQSFRIPVHANDDLRFLVEYEKDGAPRDYINDAKLVDISVTGLGFSTRDRISIGTTLQVSLQFKKTHLDFSGRIVRAFANADMKEEIIYGVELDHDKRLLGFLEKYVLSFTNERAKECLIESALKEKYTKPSDGFEMFSLLLSLFKDITHIGDREGFVENMLEEVVRLLNAERASVFLINPETSELEAIAALGCDKTFLKFDYRTGIAGSVFTSGVALNIDTTVDKTRFNDVFDKKFGFQTRSIICYPISNREDKIIGVVEVLNKRNQNRFTMEDEKTMKVLTLVFSTVFHGYDPVSEKSIIRRFSTPFDRQHILIGKHEHMGELRKAIVKLKDLDCPVLVSGEPGTGKTQFAKILHYEGTRGLKRIEHLNCAQCDAETLERELFNESDPAFILNRVHGGTLILKNVDRMPMSTQKKLWTYLMEGHLPGSYTHYDVRILATTTVDLGQKIIQGEFDGELHQLLCKAYVVVSPLRRRCSDIPDLINYFIKTECKNQGLLTKTISPKAMDMLLEYDWPGNIQELKTCVERAVLYNPKVHTITESELQTNLSVTPLMDVDAKKRIFGAVPFVSDSQIALKDRVLLVEREIILAEIKNNNGNKSNAAKKMGISREALRKKLLMSDQILSELTNTKVVSDEPALELVEDEKKAA